MIHTIGHCINFYHVSTQPVEHLRCLTKELQFESDSKPTFSFWIFGTVTGITGVLLVLIVSTIFIFAHPRIRQKAYSYFWTTHSLYSVLYILMFIHRLAKITGVLIVSHRSLQSNFFLRQAPRFWIFFIVPAIVFILDKIVSLQTKYMELDILDTELLPSGMWPLACLTPLANPSDRRCHQGEVLPASQLQAPVRPVGSSLLYRIPVQRVPLAHADLGAARKLPIGAREGAR